MEIVKLPPGEHAPVESDCISLNLLPDGGVDLSGNILAGEDSCTLLSREPYGSAEQAEAAGMAWAAENNVQRLYVATFEA